MNAVEAAWMSYATDVVLGDHHTPACTAAGGGTLEVGGTPELRWPGYIGSAFKAGGLLLVGNVHRNFDSDGVPAWVPELLVATTCSLRSDPQGHAEQYLADSRRAYLRGLDDSEAGTWNVARPFNYLLDQLGLGWDEVAYTNASKSQLVPGANLTRLVEGCLQEWPLQNLATRISASAIVTCSALARDRLAGPDVAVHYFPQRFSYRRLDEIVAELRTPPN